MRISYTFRNMESSDGVKNYASEKIGKIQKYMRAPLHAEVTFSTERHLHRVDMNLTGDGHQYAGHGHSEDMYATIDQVEIRFHDITYARYFLFTHSSVPTTASSSSI